MPHESTASLMPNDFTRMDGLEHHTNHTPPAMESGDPTSVLTASQAFAPSSFGVHLEQGSGADFR